jgi:hypothetical protein
MNVTRGNAHRNQNQFIRPKLGAREGLFIGGDQGFYYNVITTLNNLPQL